MAESATAELDVVVPVYGARGHLQDIVNALDRQVPAIRKLIISHSGPGNPTGSLHSAHTEIEYLHSERQLESGAARNRGAQRSVARWLAFLDDDVVPADDWSAVVSEQLSRESDAGCYVGSIGVDVPGGYWGMSLWFLEFGSVHAYLPARSIDGGASANMFMQRSLFTRSGGFPERVTRSVDVQFMARCRDLGADTWFLPQARVAHRNVRGFRYCRSHAISLGEGSARVRRIAEMRGSAAARYPALAPILIPARLSLMTYRTLRWGRRHRISFLYHLPGIIALLAYWSVGFYRCARQLGDRESFEP